MLQPDSQPLTGFQAGQTDHRFRKHEPTSPPELKGSSSRAICDAKFTQSV